MAAAYLPTMSAVRRPGHYGQDAELLSAGGILVLPLMSPRPLKAPVFTGDPPSRRAYLAPLFLYNTSSEINQIILDLSIR